LSNNCTDAGDLEKTKIFLRISPPVTDTWVIFFRVFLTLFWLSLFCVMGGYGTDVYRWRAIRAV